MIFNNNKYETLGSRRLTSKFVKIYFLDYSVKSWFKSHHFNEFKPS